MLFLLFVFDSRYLTLSRSFVTAVLPPVTVNADLTFTTECDTETVEVNQHDIYTGWPKKTAHYALVHIFAKY